MIKHKLILPAMLALGVLGLRADDAEANIRLSAGVEKMERRDYADAAKDFLAAELLADSTRLKAGALQEAIKAYRGAEMFYKEFELIEKLLDSYPLYADYPVMVAREYQIGDTFRDGYREPAYASLAWVPWLTGPDKAPEIYAKALERAPYSELAPAAKLELAIHYLVTFRDLEDRNKALSLLRELIANYPGSDEAYHAYLELANALFQLSQRGDGDGAYNQEGIDVMEEFLARYPEAPERDWLETMLARSKDHRAERLLGTAQFYRRMERFPATERYLNQILKFYPDSTAAAQAEKMLTELDATYVPDGSVVFEPPERLQSYAVYALPDTPNQRLIVAPENSDGRWLLPIYELDLPWQKDGKKEDAAEAE